MDFEPYNWNAMIRGAWNRAILTPSWISEKLFGLTEGTQIEVMVPINMLGPSRVKHEGFSVTVGEGFLELCTDTLTFEALHKMNEFGIKVLNELPKTPVTAIGFNIRYKLDDLNTEFADLFDSAFDNSLVTANYSFQNRQIIKGCVSNDAALNEGIINVNISTGDNIHNIEFNFHRDSKDYKELIKWLQTPAEKIESEVEQIKNILNPQAEMELEDA